MPTDVPADDFRDYGQFRKPTGTTGFDVVNGMNRSHYDLTTWGLAHVQVQPRDTLLDIGCGGGLTVERLATLAAEGTVYGVDHSADCVQWAKERNHAAIANGQVCIRQASVEQLPFDDGSFDKVFAVETVYFWPDIPRNFAEVARVVKPGGQFLIIHEAYACERFRERNRETEAKCRMHILSPKEAVFGLEQAGFSKVDVDTLEDRNWMCCAATR